MSMEERFSAFMAPVSRTVPERETTLAEVYERIRGGELEAVTGQLRRITDDKARSEFKKNALPFVTFSGVFTKRNSAELVRHSGLICLDFDHVRNFERLWEQLKADENTELALMFRSPSGDGIKAVYRVGEIKSEAEHLRVFRSLGNYIMMRYGAEVDWSGKDVCRACFLCFDAGAYLR